MAAVSIICRNVQQNRVGKSPVYLRLSHRGKSKFLATKIYVNPKKEWDNKRQRLKSCYPNSIRANEFLKGLESKGSKLAMQLNEKKVQWPDVDLKSILYANKDSNFITFSEKCIEDLETKGNYRTRKRYQTVLNKLVKYNKGRQLEFENITPGFLEDYQTYLSSIGNGKNTIHTNLKTIRAILYKAIKQGKLDQEKNPFFKFKLELGVAKVKNPNPKEIELIIQADLADSKTLSITRDAFIFSYYCAGIRVGDLLQLTPKNLIEDDILSYSMDKTKKPRLVKLPKQALDILKKYNSTQIDTPLFPFLTQTDLKLAKTRILKKVESHNAMMNLNLKKITKKLGISGNYTMHVSRNAWAQLAVKKGIDIYQISKALNHSSVTVTEKYLKSIDIDDLESTQQTLFG